MEILVVEKKYYKVQIPDDTAPQEQFDKALETFEALKEQGTLKLDTDSPDGGEALEFYDEDGREL